jgi:hypothetical protein
MAQIQVGPLFFFSQHSHQQVSIHRQIEDDLWLSLCFYAEM